MATKRISQLPVITAVTDDDFIIINDGNTVTSRINYGQFKLSLPDADIALDGLNDVSVASPADGEVLTWNAAGSEWVSAAIPAASTVALTDITDVDLSSVAPSSGQLLGYNGTNWEPVSTAGLSNITDAGYGVNVAGKIATTDGIDIDLGGNINAAGTSIDFQNATISFTGASIGGLDNSDVNLSNISDNAQGVVVNGKLATTDLELGVGGQITAAGCTVDFSSATVVFSGASVGGLQGEISDGVDFHLNQSTATDGQLLRWDATGGPQGTGDYEWVDPTAQSSSAASSFTWDASIIPDTNAQYDLGNAEYKVRHLFLSDNSIKFESGDVGITEGRLTFADTPLASAQVYQVNANGTDGYVLDGPGLVSKENPRLHLTRGQTYYFNNVMGAHPMEIRLAAGGAAYPEGVTNSGRIDGIMSFTVPMDAPDTLVYQCVAHPGMLGEIYVMNDATTRIVDTNVPASNTDAGVPGEIRYGNSFLYICVATNSWKRVALADF